MHGNISLWFAYISIASLSLLIPSLAPHKCQNWQRSFLPPQVTECFWKLGKAKPWPPTNEVIAQTCFSAAFPRYQHKHLPVVSLCAFPATQTSSWEDTLCPVECILFLWHLSQKHWKGVAHPVAAALPVLPGRVKVAQRTDCCAWESWRVEWVVLAEQLMGHEEKDPIAVFLFSIPAIALSPQSSIWSWISCLLRGLKTRIGSRKDVISLCVEIKREWPVSLGGCWWERSVPSLNCEPT